MEGGGGWNHIKKDIFEVEVFFSSQNIDFPLVEETLGAFLFLPLFPFFFSIIFLSSSKTFFFK
jgi:hypothetical protein